MNKINPLVSICIPCYNNEGFISQTIFSALNQEYKNIEVIVCDNNSSDESWNNISKINNKKLKKYKNKKNIGMVNNFKKVFNYAKGSYISFLCGDDILYKHAIKDVMSLYVKNTKIGFIFGNIDYIGERLGSTNYNYNKILKPFEFVEKSLLSGKNPTFLTGTIFKKNTYNENFIKDLLYFDWYIWLNLGLFEVGFIKKSLGTHNYHGTNTSKMDVKTYENYSSLRLVLKEIRQENIINIKTIKLGERKLLIRFLFVEISNGNTNNIFQLYDLGILNYNDLIKLFCYYLYKKILKK